MSACVRATLHSVRLCGEDTCDTRGHAVSATYPQGNSQIPAGTTNYIYYSNQWQVIEVRTGGTSVSDVSTQMVWSTAYVSAAVLQDSYASGVIQPNERLYFLQDADWNTTAVVGYNPTTQAWGVVQRYVYDSYGNITILNADWSATPSGTQPLVNALYQGMQYDPITGLYYGRARWYSPSLGRWISQDQVGYVNGANAYQMEMGGPVDRLDPQGNSPVAVGDANLPPLGSAACQAAQDAWWAGLGRAIHHAELTQEQEAGAIGCAGRGALTGGERGGAGAFHIVVLEVWDAVVGYLDTHPYPRCGPPRDILLPPFTGYGWGG